MNSCLFNCPPNKFQNKTNNICEDFVNCSFGSFRNESTNFCDKCNTSCLTCEVSFSNCSSCNAGSFFNESSCFLCDKMCLNCNGTTKNDCLTCSDSYIFQNSTCLQKNCTSNEYWDQNILACRKCDNSCNVCNGSKVNNCLSCAIGLTLYMNQCIEVKTLNFSLIPVKNPFEFLLNFSPNLSSSFFENLQKSMIIKISNFRENLFQFSLKQIPQTTNFTLNCSYKDRFFFTPPI